MKKRIIVLMTLLLCLTGCSSSDAKEYPTDYPASKAYQVSEILYPEAPGSLIIDNNIAQIDYSNSHLGYVVASPKGMTGKKIKIQISKDDQKFNYDLFDQPVCYPLQLGSGTYLIKVLENIDGTQYAIVASSEINVTLDNDLTPYLYPNILVNYHPGDTITNLGIEVVKGLDNDLERIKKIYEYVADYLSYDEQKAKEATEKYLIPDLEALINDKKGICFDYASMMVAMLRINHIPARLICGGTDRDEYHAWLEVYLDGQGWVNPDIFIDKDTWTIMDPTFASSKYDYKGQYVATLYY